MMPDTFGGTWRRPSNSDRGHSLRQLRDHASFDNQSQTGCGWLFLLCILAIAAAIGAAIT
ncbi:hypothetical protein ACIRF8_12790 [Streptomyces sp. NPDC102406]|uniref:hypothetical protein n=1 Tax=Streptomyces sp. NPDC102406 TaxID=3366171 RepID=UPI0038202C23